MQKAGWIRAARRAISDSGVARTAGINLERLVSDGGVGAAGGVASKCSASNGGIARAATLKGRASRQMHNCEGRPPSPIIASRIQQESVCRGLSSKVGSNKNYSLQTICATCFAISGLSRIDSEIGTVGGHPFRFARSTRTPSTYNILSDRNGPGSSYDLFKTNANGPLQSGLPFKAVLKDGCEREKR